MTVTIPDRKTLENPSGKGWVFKGEKLIAEVAYELEVLQTNLKSVKRLKLVVTGKIRRLDSANVLWGNELMTLHLQDQRKLDFICVNFDPECNIASDTGFYH